jgi:hypothetical protein|tara:strand:+ start:525 stop:803 length:279 start_codon:yes stop_codon:yes gene_type:complete
MVIDSESALQAMKDKENQLNESVETGQADFINQMKAFKTKHDELETKVKDGESVQANLEKSKFLVTALQLKCKKLISAQLEKERKDAQELRQ